MTKNEKETLMGILQKSKKAFSEGDVEKEQQLVEDAINYVSSH